MSDVDHPSHLSFCLSVCLSASVYIFLKMETLFLRTMVRGPWSESVRCDRRAACVTLDSSPSVASSQLNSHGLNWAPARGTRNRVLLKLVTLLRPLPKTRRVEGVSALGYDFAVHAVVRERSHLHQAHGANVVFGIFFVRGF